MLAWLPPVRTVTPKENALVGRFLSRRRFPPPGVGAGQAVWATSSHRLGAQTHATAEPERAEVETGGEAILGITQIGKHCQDRCSIFRQTGDCIMPRVGLFARVLAGGAVAVGDPVEIEETVPCSVFQAVVLTLSDRCAESYSKRLWPGRGGRHVDPFVPCPRCNLPAGLVPCTGTFKVPRCQRGEEEDVSTQDTALSGVWGHDAVRTASGHTGLQGPGAAL